MQVPPVRWALEFMTPYMFCAGLHYHAGYEFWKSRCIVARCLLWKHISVLRKCSFRAISLNYGMVCVITLGTNHIPVHLIWRACMGGNALSMNIAQLCQLENHDIIDNGVAPFICIYIPPPCGMCSYALMHHVRLTRTGADPQHARGGVGGWGVCPTFMYTHLYYHELILLSYCGPLHTLIVALWLRHASAHVQTCMAGLKPPCHFLE